MTTHAFMRRAICLATALFLCAICEAAGQSADSGPATKQSVIVAIRPPGAGTVSGQGNYAPGSPVLLTATPAPHYFFSHWEGRVTNPSSPRTHVYVGEASVSLTAVFTREKIRILSRVEPPSSGTIEGAGMVARDTRPVFYAHAAPGYEFAGWDGPVTPAKAGSQSGAKTLPGAQLARPLTAPVTVTARFRPVEQRCRVGLSVDGNPAGGSVEGAGVHPRGSRIVIRAIPAPGYGFNGWSRVGAGPDAPAGIADPGATETTLFVTGDIAVQASFVPEKALVRARVSPEGAGKVTGDLGIRPVNQAALLAAEPAKGYVFAGWDGPVSENSRNKPVTTLTPAESKAYVVTARFRPAR